MRRTLGALLAGGQARRFGADKALARWRGKSLIEHAADALRPHCDRVVIVGRDRHDLRCVPDRPASGLGPLGGIAGALAHASENGMESVLTAPCDVPCPPHELFEALRPAACWCEEHPAFGRWPATLAPTLASWLRTAEHRSIRAFARTVGAIPISVPTPIRDVDTPEDLAAL
ncbi:molybdenum cofactor guanylyltransferase [Stakelama saccharophila]|uniref:Molybdenum cofactor guanylyltransferase n=1 Tax=Stakelama saccharophila TaxID=3075605 RepID=A0ABZ0BC57_9SPHN|nr:molybdenum cofactor guanylyltransferase [Stakelama sp. W311]WNO54943.1 molybdenum cofactor guanylyltransferase [Stakelama sp. W311]